MLSMVVRLRSLAVLSAACALLLAASASAWSDGSGTCDADAPSVLTRTALHPLAPTMQFYLSLPSSYSPGSTYNVSIMNTGRLPPISYFNGFLLYASAGGDVRVGSFSGITQGTTTDMRRAAEAERDPASGRWTCRGSPGATVTHSDGNIKEPNFRLQWTAPNTDVGPLTWRGLVESSGVRQYLQLLQPQRMCGPGQSCAAFNTSALPLGPLPPPPSGASAPRGLQPADATACAQFEPVPFAAVPAGFCASVYANELSRPRGIYVTAAGDLLVVETGAWQGVALLRDLNDDGRIDRLGGEYLRLFEQSGLNHGLYVHGGFVYVSSPTTVWRLRFDPFDAARPLTAQNATVVVRDLPEARNHGTRTPLLSHDGRWLYVSVGSAGNVDDDDRRARVIRYDLRRPIPAGGHQWDNYDNSDGAVQAFAKGLRNEVGLTLDLQGEVWGVMNADDNLNRPDLGGPAIHNDNPAERLDHLREERMDDGFYGYPYCWAVDILPNHTRGDIFAWGGAGKDFYLDGVHTDAWCRENTIRPSYALQAHTAPLGVLFYDGKGRYAFPPEYYQQILIAEHGSWNSDTPRGYKLARIETDDRGQPIPDSLTDFFAYQGPGAIGLNWAHKPVDVRIGPHGELFFSSDTANAVLVLRYINPQVRPVLISQQAVSGAGLESRGGPTTAWADFSFDRDGSRSTANSFAWVEGEEPHQGVAILDGAHFIDAYAYNSGAGTVMPALTGGPSSYEAWLWLQDASFYSSSTLLELADNSTGVLDDVISIALAGREGSERASLVVTVQSTRGASTVAEVRGAVPLRNWTHVVLTVGGRELSVYVDGALVHSEFLRTPPQRMARSSALIGRGLLEPSEPLLRAGLDVLRVYSYVLSGPQVRLNYLMSAQRLITPLLYGHFAMQPTESSEATFDYQGAASRRPPPAAAQPPPPPPPGEESLFPGWAHFERPGSHVDLLNPNNGIGAVWPSGRLGGGAFSIELWFRLSEERGEAQVHLLLIVDGVLAIGIQPDGSLVLVIDNVEAIAVPQGFRWTRWHHLVWTAIAVDRERTAHLVYINGQLVVAAPTARFRDSVPTIASLGGVSESYADLPPFNGDIAAFRVYREPLSAELVQAAYAAQMYGHEQPQPPPPSSSSSTGQAPAALSSSSYSGSSSGSSSSAFSSTTSAATSVPASLSSPTSAPVSPTSASTAGPTAPPPSPVSSSTGEGNGSEEGMSTAAYVAVVLIVVVLLAAAVVGVVVCLRRRTASRGGSDDDRLNRLIPEGEAGDSYSRL